MTTAQQSFDTFTEVLTMPASFPAAPCATPVLISDGIGLLSVLLAPMAETIEPSEYNDFLYVTFGPVADAEGD